MSQLPARPDLDQLRRQARELHQAARDGDARSLRRLGQAPGAVTLSAAQLSVARDYGFASWPRLKAEVERCRAALAGLLTSEADDLIAGQYRDRHRLRPVLDAVLAALPALGPVTVQARGTIVSLVTPRRTFAVVKATTKSRVDLGLRLDSTQPGGRLLPARDLGAATVRIPLTAPDEIDEEALGWLRRAYDENAAPSPPRRPARRPAPALGTLTVVIEGFDLPGLTCAPEPGGQVHQNIHVALTGPGKDRPALAVPGNRWLAIEPARGDAPSAHWEVPVTVRRGTDGFDFSGPFVRGDRTDRHLGLAWGDVPGDGTLRLFRGAKLRLVDIDPAIIEQAIRPGRRLVARIRLTDAIGNPVCARVHPPALAWSAEPG
jgi:Family of unknown function (DUF5990)/Domain of unknown function (DUF5655)